MRQTLKTDVVCGMPPEAASRNKSPPDGEKETFFEKLAAAGLYCKF